MLNYRIFTVLFSLLGVLLLTSCGSRSTWYGQFSPAQYAHLQDSLPEPYLIDVRTSGEYTKGHIHHALLLNYLAPGFRKKVRKLDASRPVMVYCQTAHRSPLAAKKLKKAGFRFIYDLEGGFKNWSISGMPMEK